uniref:THAP-type domain-containing protein n=1 Tax=Anopheles epiroticus TaxID=199890 RepID=A0A182P2D3_9DIPT
MQTYRANSNKKYCAYFGCNHNSLLNPEITFFAFPAKHPERCEAWKKLAGVSESLLENRMYRFLCERHFPNIYFVRSQRRLLLLGNAAPHPCEQTDADDLQSGEEVEVYEMTSEDTIATVPSQQLEDSDGKHSTDEEEFNEIDAEAYSQPAEVHRPSSPQKESAVNVAENDARDIPTKDEPKPDPASPGCSDINRKRKQITSTIAEMKVKVLSTSAGAMAINKKALQNKTVQIDGKTVQLVQIKRKNPVQNQSITIMPIVEDESIPASKTSNDVVKAVEMVKSSVSSSTSSLETVPQAKDTATKPATSEDVSIENDDKISQFIFKGEEYVQMPKEHFLNKINRLKRSVVYYESIIKGMRSVLDQADVPSSLD